MLGTGTPNPGTESYDLWCCSYVTPSTVGVFAGNTSSDSGKRDPPRHRTWTHHDGTFWPRDRLFKSIPNARVMLFSYNSSVMVDVANVSIAHHATSLLDKLYGFHEKRYAEIRKATFGLVFFGTPHQGGNGATHGVLSVMTGQTTNTLLKTLVKGSFLNEATSDQFRPQLNDYKVLTFYESKKTPPKKKSWGWVRSLASEFVVDRTSAKLGSSNEILLDLNADHSQLCKFSKEPDDAAYETVGRNIKDLCDQALQQLEYASVKDIEDPEPVATIIGIKGFEMHMQSVTGQRDISPSLINLADYTRFFSRREFDAWLFISGSVPSFRDMPDSGVSAHHGMGGFGPRADGKERVPNEPQLFKTDKIILLTGPRGSGKRNFNPPQVMQEPATLNNDNLLDSIRESLRENPSRLELTIFIEGLENAGQNQEERKEFLISILNLFQDMVKRKPLFKATRMLLVSRYDLGIERTIKEARVRLISIQFAQECTECLNTLQITGVTDRRALVSDAHPGSLQWLRVHPEYCKWVRARHSSMLWIQGKPASGKSTLFKYFREQILPVDARDAAGSAFYIVADFFYSYRGGELGKSHKRREQTINPEYITSNLFHQLHKVLMSSRPNVEAESVLRDCRQIIRMQDENRDDIGAFVSYYFEEVYRDLGFGEQEYLDVKEYIVEKSQGVFLWTHFVVQELAGKAQRGLSRREIRETLESLPSELYEFSQPMAVPISSSPHVFTKEDLEDNLIRPTVKRPILCRGGNLVETKYRENVDELFPYSLVYAVPNLDGQDVGIVQLMHQSARDFLLRPDGYMRKTKRFDFRDRACHGILAIICLRYLQLIVEKTIKTATPVTSPTDNDTCVNGRCSIDTLRTSSTDNDAVTGAIGWCGVDIEEFITYLDEKRLFHYALKYLPWHMNRTDTNVESGRIAEELYNKLFDKMNEPSFRHVRRIYRNAFLKVPALVDRSIAPGTEQLTIDDEEQSTIDDEEAVAFEDSLIKTAAQAGKLDVLLALVQNAAANDPKSFMILQSHVELGNEQALRLFLDNGPKADLDEHGGEHGNVLNLAAYCGHLSIVRILLDRGAHINIATSEYGNVLEAAVAGAGSEEVVRLLIDRGAYGINFAAVELASFHGNQRVVDLLVNRGAAIVAGKTAMFLGDEWGASASRRSTRAPALCTNPVNPIEIDFHRTRIRHPLSSQVNWGQAAKLSTHLQNDGNSNEDF
ncbi:hypothetical protein K440DRAFT_664068 [Wilcoxina mikolae CBS 423.85]|nr:hypothetical protein K440DRAFT_664068 [Wilcoxina mikolae CBS 423.85]